MGTYAVGVTRALARRGVNDYVLFVPPAYRDFWSEQVPSGATLVACGPHPNHRAARVLFEQLRLPGQAARHGVETIFFPMAVAPRWRWPRAVVTIHDLLLLSRPTDFPWRKRAYLRWVYGRVARRAAHLVTVSHFCKREICDKLGVPAHKITVASSGVDEVFLAPPGGKNGRLELPSRYLLSVAGAYPHKRLGVLVDAFEVVARDETDLHLVLVGTHTGRPEAIARVREQAARARAADRIVFVPPLAREAVPAVFAGAAALVSASEFEGFGIPVLEAMAVGCPVAASPAEAVVEVLGGSGFLARDFTVDALARAVRAALSARGGDMIRRAQDRARMHYTWEAAASELERAFREGP